MSDKYSPDHYQQGSIEVWDFIVDQKLGYLEGNVISTSPELARRTMSQGSMIFQRLKHTSSN